MKKQTKLGVQWFYSLLEQGECDIMDFKEQLEDKMAFGKSLKNFAPKYDEMARDVVAFANNKGGFLLVGIVDGIKEINKDFVYDNEKVFDLIHQVQDRTEPTITLIPHKINVEGTDLLVLSVTFRIKADVVSEKLIELSLQYESQTNKSMKLDELLVLSEIIKHKQAKVADLGVALKMTPYRLQCVLDQLHHLEFIEPTGKTSGLSYILHVSKRRNTGDKIEYVRTKKQDKARQKEAILRYLDAIDTINNTEARELLKLQDKDRPKVSRLFAELVDEKEIVQTEDSVANNVKYSRIRKG